MSFSERYGFKPKKAIQIEGMDEELRACLWNCFSDYIGIEIKDSRAFCDITIYLDNEGKSSFRKFFWKKLYTDVLKIPIPLHEPDVDSLLSQVKNLVLTLQWNKVYDLIEFSINQYNRDKKPYIDSLNKILEQENSGFRIIKDKIVPITSETEIQELETALENPLNGVKEHLKTALQHFSDRKKPNYRNSIAESIHAVESLCRKITGKNTLADALKDLEKHGLKLHSALKEAFIKLYGYTSAEEGLRHSILDGNTKIEKADAHFFLVSCSAFVNYLTVKAEKLGIIIASA